MAYEIRGSILVYLAIIVSASFTPSARVATFLGLTLYSVWFGDFLADIPFYAGALLADLSLVLASSASQNTVSSWNTGPRFRGIKNTLPMALGLFGLFLGSYPPDATEMSSWSIFITNLGLAVFPSDCTCLIWVF